MLHSGRSRCWALMLAQWSSAGWIGQGKSSLLWVWLLAKGEGEALGGEDGQADRWVGDEAGREEWVDFASAGLDFTRTRCQENPPFLCK